MDTNLISNIYIACLGNRVSSEEREVNICIERSDYFLALSKYGPPYSLKNVLNDYRINYQNYSQQQLDRLNSEIMGYGLNLLPGTLLFHGRGSVLSGFDRPISCSTHPTKAIWHAMKHRDHQINGADIYIYSIEIRGHKELRACADFSDSEFGHEYEVIVQSGAIFNEIRRTEIFTGVYVIEGTICA